MNDNIMSRDLKRMSNSSRKVQYLAGLCVSFAFTFTGAVISWPSPAIPKFIYGNTGIKISDEQTSWVVSLAALGALPACYIGKVLSEKKGRRFTILSAPVPGIMGAILIIFTKSPLVMCVARTLMGISNGVTAVVTMIYLTEIADKEIRGALGMLVQVMINLGSLSMYTLGPFIPYTALNGIVLTISLLCVAMSSWVPESPYYHLTRGKIAEAKKDFMFIKGTKDELWVDEQVDAMRVHVQQSMENKTTAKELFTNKKYRNAVYIVAGLKILQYMTGSLAIQSYMEMIFRHTTKISGPMVSIVYGFVQLGAGIGATFLARYFGRRILMLVSCTGVALSLTSIGIYFYLQDYQHVSSYTLSHISVLPIVGVLGFNILYAVGLGNIPYILQAELFPINVKATASSIATMLACVLNFFITKMYQNVKNNFGLYTVFWAFASIAYIGILFIYFYVPETKGKTLEEVQNMQNAQDNVEVEKLNK